MAMGFGVACVLIGRLELQLSWVWTGVPSNAVIDTRFFFPTESYVEEERKYLISDSRACWMAHAVALSKKRERERKAIFFVPSKIKESHVRFLSLTACLYLLNLTTLLFLYHSGQGNVNLMCGECEASRASTYQKDGRWLLMGFILLPALGLSLLRQAKIWVLRARRGLEKEHWVQLVV